MYYRSWNYSHVHVHLVSKSGLDLGMLVRKLKLYKWIIFNLSVFFQNQGSRFLRLICVVPSLFPALHYKTKLMGAEKFGLIFLSSSMRLNMPFSDSLSETTNMCEGKICFSSGQGTCMGGWMLSWGKWASPSRLELGHLPVQLSAFPLNRGGKTTSNFFPMPGKS